MSKRPGRSFVVLVGAGTMLAFAGVLAVTTGLETIADCYWVGIAGRPHQHFPAVCMRPIAVTGYHLFVPIALLLCLLCPAVVLGFLRTRQFFGSTRNAELVLGPHVHELPDVLAVTVEEVGATNVEVREDNEPYGVCLGLLRPRIAVSTGLISLLSKDELVAVLAHEERHRRRRAPLRQFVARATARTLFFLPVLDGLLDVHLVEEELLADQESVATVGTKPLAGALAKLSTCPSVAGVSAFGHGSTLSYRIRALREGSTALPSLSLHSWVTSAGSLGALALVVFWMPVVGLH